MFGLDGPFDSSDLTITPDVATVVGGFDAFTFTAGGGTGLGYVYSFVHNNSGGSLNSVTGDYSPGAVLSGSVVDTIRVTDSGSNTADAVITVNESLKILPAESTATTGGTIGFTAVGGIPPYFFEFQANNSDGNVNSSTGLYTAGAIAPVDDFVTCEDTSTPWHPSVFADSSAVVHVVPMLLDPDEVTVPPLGTQTFTPVGGTGPYVFEILDNQSGGSIDPDTGAYTAGSLGLVDDIIQVTDSNDVTAQATAHVGSELSTTPPSPFQIHAGASQTFVPSGGSGTGYVFSEYDMESGGSCDSSGHYIAGNAAGLTDTLLLEDSLGNQYFIEIFLRGVEVAPTFFPLPPLGSQTFTATWGSGTGYTWSMNLNGSGGSINPTTGAYTAGTTPNSTDVVMATDSLGNTGVGVVNIGNGVSISPTTPTKSPRATQTFVGSGGSGTGFVYALTVNNSGATINASTGLYTAGATGSVNDVVRVTDSLGNIGTTAVHVSAQVSISPSNPNVLHDRTQLFTALGGSGTGYAWSLTVNNSGATINPTTGLYTAGPTFGVSDTVRVVDSLSNVKTTNVTVSNLIAIWDVTVSPDTQGSLRFTMTAGSVFDLSLVHEGDLAYIYGDEFGPSNTNGTYTITRVSITYDPDLIAWFEISNPLGEELLEVQQIRFEDLMFFRPKRRTIYDNPRRVLVCEKAD